MNILFRADSSSKIGNGHIMRDLVLAKQYSESNIFFATQNLDGNINQKIIEAGYKVIDLKSNHKEELLETLDTLNIDLLVVDNYKIDYNYETYLKENSNVKILVLDDTYEKHNCDILLNHNISADKRRYIGLLPKDCELRCGSKYTLLRDEFIIEKSKFQIKKLRRDKTIFIAMGGSDHSNITLKILKAIPTAYHVDIATSSTNKNLKSLQGFIKRKKKCSLYIDSNNIAKIMYKSDMAIVSPSVVSHEVLYMGLPFISILTGNDQKDIFKYYTAQKMITMKNFNSKKLSSCIMQLDCNLHRYKNIVKRVRQK